MGRCAIQIVMGPAGSGKSTYCYAVQEHAAVSSSKQVIHVANLDPAAEIFPYTPIFDVRDLISVSDVMEELGLGPNGALLYCMEYLLENLDFLHDELESFGDEDYLILDCPGQLELYTHVPIMRHIIDKMKMWGYGDHMASIFCVDATFLTDSSKFLSGSLLSLSAMIAMELAHISVLTKCDLMDNRTVERILALGSATELWDLEEDQHSLLGLSFAKEDDDEQKPADMARLRHLEQRRQHRNRLTTSICQLLDDWQMVSFVPLNINDEESLDHLLLTVNHALQWGDDLEVRGADGDDLPPGYTDYEENDFTDHHHG